MNPRALRITAATTATAGLVLSATACGGSPAAPGGGGSSHDRALAYAGCLRRSGVPNWPDPTSSGAFDKTKLTPQQLGASASRISAAETACRGLSPNGGRTPDQAQRARVAAQARSFSRCVRAHGVPGFPDPGSDGRIPDPATVGVDQGSPRFQSANRACATDR
ncbi:MAG TPA: hypothetical protein VFB26_04200, partial [Gaiellaceae bacterium]|nr:hypothetical protein [Gaiellaceae bacterium]